jgi:DNA-binding LytR/AlgR family response regulator
VHSEGFSNEIKTRCLIIDDEPPARDLLISYASQLDDLVVLEQFANAPEAFSFLQKNPVDLIFLDIQMPGMNGLELIRSLHQRPGIILTTAFREYATDGFDLDVLDYLVKPISFSRFMKAIAKFHHYFTKPPEGIIDSEKNYNEAYIFIKVGKDQIKVYFKDILYIECIKDYLRIITSDKTYVTYDRLMYMEEKLPDGRFLRIHKSFIISVGMVKSFRNDKVIIGDVGLPVGRVYKQKFLEAFSKKG